MSASPPPHCYDTVKIFSYFFDPLPLSEHANSTEIVAGKIRLKMIFGLLCCYYCALAWALFDHLLTFHDEVVYVWKRPMQAGSILFYMVRYLGLASLLAGIAIYSWPEGAYTWPDLQSGCLTPELKISAHSLAGEAERVMFFGVPALQFVVFWIVEVILQTRIFALYGNICLALFNGLLFILVMAAMVGLWWDAYAPMELIELSSSIGPSLEYTYSAVYWSPAIVFELWLAALALRKLRPQVLKHDLLSVIVRDSIRYFFFVALVMVAHVVGSFEAFGSYVIPFVIAGQTIAGSRLVLHLRRAYFRGHDAEGSANLSFAARTTGIPVPRSRFADETFYVHDNLSDDEFIEDVI